LNTFKAVPTGQFTPADLALIEEVKSRCGVDLSPRQLQEGRRAGLVPGPATESLGHGRGSRSQYPSEAADAATRLARALAQAPLRLATLGLFGVGVTPTERSLRDAYRALLDRSQRSVRAAHARSRLAILSTEDRREYVELQRSAPEIDAAWRQHAQQVAATERATGDVLNHAPLSTTWKQVRDREAFELLTAVQDPDRAHIEPALRGAFGATDEHIDALDAVGGPVSIGERRYALDHTSYEDLIACRDVFLANQQESMNVLPPAFRPLFAAALDDPLSGGMIVASIVLDVAALLLRQLPDLDPQDM
jgi:hypothetical protein